LKTVKLPQFPLTNLPLSILAWIGISLAVFAPSVSTAEPVTFIVEVGGVAKAATVDEFEREGKSYVSVVSLAEQFGGAVSLLTTRARVELSGSTAWIQAGDNRVNAFRIFSLAEPIVRTEDDYLIASADVTTFFEKAFRLTIGKESLEGPSPAMEIATPVLPVTEAVTETAMETPERPRDSSVEVIVIDPGHGGFETGVEGTGGLSEKELVLDIARKVKAALEPRINQRIVLTREDDLALNELQRAAIIQNSEADLLLTLHTGSSLSKNVRGSMVLCEAGNTRVHGRRMPDREGSRRLGGLMADSFRGVSSLPFRGIDTVETRSMAHPGLPGVMVEIGCLTNADDETALTDEATRATVADAIARAVLTFLGIAPEPAIGDGTG
jgi:N-acetylmuramoyl-L-alanine amidase